VFLGHFAVALGVKKVAPKASLGSLFFAVQLADLVWPIFLLLGWEEVRIEPDYTRFTPLDFVSYPYSHSLIAQALWGLALGAVYLALRRDVRTAMVVAVCVPSHWLLDWIAHAPDMPIVPGGARYGLGLWNSPAATLSVEFLLFATGTAIYLKTTRPRALTGTYALWSLLVFLVVAYLGASFGPPPPSAHATAVSALALWVLIPWAAWADRYREMRPSSSQAHGSP
jgi:hypothetical protein